MVVPSRPSSSVAQGYDRAYKRVRLSILRRDGCCQLCGSLDHLQVDHLVPLSKGGTNHPSNLRVLCRRCNLNRREMPPSWAQSKQQIRQRFAARAPTGALVEDREAAGRCQSTDDVVATVPVHRTVRPDRRRA